MKAKKSVLYIINFYGTPPLNYFEKFLVDGHRANLTILKLPAVRSNKNRLAIDAFIKDERGVIKELKFDIFFPLPYFFAFFAQYILNFIFAFILLRRVKRKEFDIIIGETNFGSALAYLLKSVGKGKFSVFFNGDIIPKPASSSACFFLPNGSKHTQRVYKFIDTSIIWLQIMLRKIGYKNDLVWYGNTKVQAWDKDQHMHTSHFIIYDPIKVDYRMFTHWRVQQKNQYDICYIGRIDDYVGLDKIIPAVAELKKDFPLLKLHIIGGSTTTYQKYDNVAKKNGAHSNIVFHGYVPNMHDAHEIMSHCVLGMALYKPVIENVSMYAQPAKPKDYIQVNVPVLVTKTGPSIGQEIVAANAGIDAHFSVHSVYLAISSVLTDKKLQKKLQIGVEQYAKLNDYNHSFKYIWSDLLSRSSI